MPRLFPSSWKQGPLPPRSAVLSSLVPRPGVSERRRYGGEGGVHHYSRRPVRGVRTGDGKVDGGGDANGEESGRWMLRAQTFSRPYPDQSSWANVPGALSIMSENTWSSNLFYSRGNFSLALSHSNWGEGKIQKRFDWCITGSLICRLGMCAPYLPIFLPMWTHTFKSIKPHYFMACSHIMGGSWCFCKGSYQNVSWYNPHRWCVYSFYDTFLCPCIPFLPAILIDCSSWRALVVFLHVFPSLLPISMCGRDRRLWQGYTYKLCMYTQFDAGFSFCEHGTPICLQHCKGLKTELSLWCGDIIFVYSFTKLKYLTFLF